MPAIVTAGWSGRDGCSRPERDFEGTYTRVEPRRLIEYRMEDGREVRVQFSESGDGVLVRETFDPETENDPELQREGWQAILDNFTRHVEKVHA